MSINKLTNEIIFFQHANIEHGWLQEITQKKRNVDMIGGSQMREKTSFFLPFICFFFFKCMIVKKDI